MSVWWDTTTAIGAAIVAGTTVATEVVTAMAVAGVADTVGVGAEAGAMADITAPTSIDPTIAPITTGNRPAWPERGELAALPFTKV